MHVELEIVHRVEDMWDTEGLMWYAGDLEYALRRRIGAFFRRKDSTVHKGDTRSTIDLRYILVHWMVGTP